MRRRVMVIGIAANVLKRIALNSLGRGALHGRNWSQGSQPFLSGNRIFIRSYTDVYCIGDASGPLRLSNVHQ